MKKIKRKQWFQNGHITKFASVVNRFSQIYYERECKGFQIGCGQQFFLLAVEENPGISQFELAQEMGFDKGTTAKAVKKLEEAGLLRKERDNDDKRIYKLFVTEKAETILRLTVDTVEKWEKILTKGMKEEEKKEAEKYFRKMAENAVSYIWDEI